MGLIGDVAGGIWGGAKSLGGGFKNFLSGGPGYEYQDRAMQEEYINAGRGQEAESRAFQAALAQQYQDALSGNAPSIAEQQLAATTAQNQQQQIAMARSGGGPMGNSGAQYEAARNAAGINQMANRDAATLRAQEQASNMQGAASMYGDMRAADQGYMGAEMDYEATKAGINADAQAAKAAAQEASARRNAGGGLIGGFAQAYGAVRGGGASGGSK